MMMSEDNTEANGLKQFLRAARGNNIVGLLGFWLMLFVFFAIMLPEAFSRPGTYQAMMFQIPELGLLSLAMAIPLISGGLNLAIIATANQLALLMGWILTTQMPPDAAGLELTLWLVAAFGAGLLLAIVIGALTGALIAVLGVHPILVTLGTMTLINGVSIYFGRGTTISGFPEPLLALSNSTVFGMPWSFILFLLLALLVHILLTRMPLGIRIHMIGSNLDATRYSGVDHRKVLISVYVLSSVLCWFAALVMMSRFNSAGADFAQSYLLITILAAIFGGIDPYGGFGRIGGLVVALAILQTVSSGFNLLGLSSQMTLVFWGGGLILVMAVKRIAAIRRMRPRASRAAPELVSTNQE